MLPKVKTALCTKNALNALNLMLGLQFSAFCCLCVPLAHKHNEIPDLQAHKSSFLGKTSYGRFFLKTIFMVPVDFIVHVVLVFLFSPVAVPHLVVLSRLG